MTCVAQQEAPASEKYKMTYDAETQNIINWDPTMTVALDSINVMDAMNANAPLPDNERRLKNKILTDLMREARENQPEN